MQTKMRTGKRRGENRNENKMKLDMEMVEMSETQSFHLLIQNSAGSNHQ
jgi:hypothetical protein